MSTSPSVHIYSFFSGSGFLDLGFEDAGFNVVFANEISPSFLNAYRFARKSMGRTLPLHGTSSDDVTTLISNPLLSQQLSQNILQSRNNAGLVGFIGGPPCPDFSIAGKNHGHTGENGRLSQTYIDLICLHQPDFFLFENVKGLYRTKKHRLFFEGLKEQLSESGYECTEKLINAIEYGAPQDRERIILIGFLKKKDNHNLSLEKFDWDAYTTYNTPDVFSKNWPAEEKPSETRLIPDNIYPELTIQYWFEKNQVQNHPNSKHAFTPRAGLKRFIETCEGDVAKKSYKRLHRWRYSPTAAYGNNEVHIHPYIPRRLSVAEALAIQSLPKSFCLPPTMTLSDMFKTIGNGVPYLAALGIANNIMDFLKKKETHETDC